MRHSSFPDFNEIKQESSGVRSRESITTPLIVFSCCPKAFIEVNAERKSKWKNKRRRRIVSMVPFTVITSRRIER